MMYGLGSASPRLGAALALAVLVAAPALATDYYVDDDAPAGGDGLSWATAFNSLDVAIDTAAGGDALRVAQGTYVLQGGMYEQLTFELDNAYGGYAGWNAPDSDLRDPEAFPTILSGDVNGDDTPDFQNLDDNREGVVGIAGAVDGFVITGANTLGVYEGNTMGGGVLRNCRFHHNTGGAGGALFVEHGPSAIENCVFESNRALWDLTPNTDSGRGGAVYVHASNVRFTS